MATLGALLFLWVVASITFSVAGWVIRVLINMGRKY